MKIRFYPVILLATIMLFFSCNTTQESMPVATDNPVFNELNEPIDFAAITADHITEAAEVSTAKAYEEIERISSIPQEERNFKNTIVAIDDFIDELVQTNSTISLLSKTHADSLIRVTAIAKSTEISKFFNEIQLSEPLYKAVSQYSQTEEGKNLSGHRAKYVKETLKEFKRNGLELPEDQREILKQILDEISQIGDDFINNINAYQDFLIVDEEGMKGMPEDYKKSHLQEDGTYKITMAYPDYIPFMRYSESSEDRKKLSIKFGNRAADSNLEVLKKLIAKRTEMANLLGYETYAEYELEPRMAKKPETVWDFESGLEEKLKPKGFLDYDELLAIQRKLGDDSKTIKQWNSSYIRNILLEENYGVDQEEVRKYFELDNVKRGLFDITQNLFGIEYRKIENPSVWHQDVDAYEVFQDNEMIGRFYLDLHPRPNKYGHAQCSPFIYSKQREKAYQNPAAALICNFSEPTDEKPALLTHNEVITFFHEFGHVLHHTLSKTELMSQAGFSVAWDFVEAPSQIFENWAWNYESLSLFARHFETDEVMPKELFDKMYAAKNVGSGLSALGQVFYGVYALTLYDDFDPNGEKSTTQVWDDLYKKITFYEPVEGTHREAAFGHLNGYGSGYYGYMWSKVFAQDMFSRFEEEGVLNPEVGKNYRDMVLARGGTREEMEMLREFLGREPNQDAFVKSLGL